VKAKNIIDDIRGRIKRSDQNLEIEIVEMRISKFVWKKESEKGPIKKDNMKRMLGFLLHRLDYQEIPCLFT
jgi:hypothetical protein